MEGGGTRHFGGSGSDTSDTLPRVPLGGVRSGMAPSPRPLTSPPRSPTPPQCHLPPSALYPSPLPPAPPPHGTLLYFMASLPVSFSPRLPPWHSSLFLPLLLARFFYHVFFFFPPRVYSLNFFFASCFLFYFHCHLA